MACVTALKPALPSLQRLLNSKSGNPRFFSGLKKTCVLKTSCAAEKTEDRITDSVDKLVDGISFGQLCDDFECNSSPAVERTARQLARDISELRENRREIGCYAISMKYKDPLRSFTGRDKLRRPSWILNALNYPEVALLEMTMKDTCHLVIRYSLKGTFPGPGMVAGTLRLTVTSSYVLNQISGQVTEQEDQWDFSGSSPLAVATFFSSRLAWSSVEASKDLSEKVKEMSEALGERAGDDIYVDPSDPKRFFSQANPNSELFQVGFFIALLYLVVQFLRLTL